MTHCKSTTHRALYIENGASTTGRHLRRGASTMRSLGAVDIDTTRIILSFLPLTDILSANGISKKLHTAAKWVSRNTIAPQALKFNRRRVNVSGQRFREYLSKHDLLRRLPWFRLATRFSWANEDVEEFELCRRRILAGAAIAHDTAHELSLDIAFDDVLLQDILDGNFTAEWSALTHFTMQIRWHQPVHPSPSLTYFAVFRNVPSIDVCRHLASLTSLTLYCFGGAYIDCAFLNGIPRLRELVLKPLRERDRWSDTPLCRERSFEICCTVRVKLPLLEKASLVASWAFGLGQTHIENFFAGLESLSDLYIGADVSTHSRIRDVICRTNLPLKRLRLCHADRFPNTAFRLLRAFPSITDYSEDIAMLGGDFTATCPGVSQLRLNIKHEFRPHVMSIIFPRVRNLTLNAEVETSDFIRNSWLDITDLTLMGKVSLDTAHTLQNVTSLSLCRIYMHLKKPEVSKATRIVTSERLGRMLRTSNMRSLEQLSIRFCGFLIERMLPALLERETTPTPSKWAKVRFAFTSTSKRAELMARSMTNTKCLKYLSVEETATPTQVRNNWLKRYFDEQIPREHQPHVVELRLCFPTCECFSTCEDADSNDCGQYRPGCACAYKFAWGELREQGEVRHSFVDKKASSEWKHKNRALRKGGLY